MVRFVHTADWQLGTSRRWLGAGPSARLADARIQAIGRMGALAAERGADFLLVCGDVFDLQDVPTDVLHQALDALAEVPVPVHLVPGNHDPAGPGGLWRRPELRDQLPAHVHVHEDPTPVPVADGVELVPVPWPGKRPERDLVADALASLEPTPHGRVRVLGAHGAIDPVLSAGRRTDIDLATVRAALAGGVVHYVALGDHHAPTRAGEDDRIRYPGTPEPTDWRDASPGRVLLVDLDPAAPDAATVTDHVIGDWTFSSLEQRVVSDHDVERLAGLLEELPGKRTHALRLTLAGALSPGGRAALDQVLARASARLAALVVRDEHLLGVPDLEDLTGSAALGLGYVGFVEDAVTELRDRHGAGATGPAGADDAGSGHDHGHSPDHDHDHGPGDDAGPAVEQPSPDPLEDPREAVRVPALDAVDAGGVDDAEAAGDALVLLHTWARAEDATGGGRA